MRLIVGAGGTGGGVYPALAVLQALNLKHNEVLWVGSEGGMETQLVQRAGYPFVSIPAAGVHGVGVKALPGNLARLSRGLLAARRILKEFSPDTLFFTGGYVSLPIAMAGRRIPSLLFMPDIEPGLSVKLIARYATRIAVPTAESLQYFDDKSRLVVTGYPTRTELKKWSRAEARKKLQLEHGRRVLLVFGGSQGAQSINRQLYPQLPELLSRMQVVHLCGSNNWEENERERARLPQELASFYHPFPYLHSEELGAAFQSADLVVSRAGAAVMGEYPLFALPAILVPYPFAWRYQETNARYLESRGAAIILQDAEIASSLRSTVFNLFDHPGQLESMSAAMRSLSNQQAAETLSRLLENLGEQLITRSNGGLQ